MTLPIICNDSNDPTYENWLALYVCIVNKKFSIKRALNIIGFAEEMVGQSKENEYEKES